MIATFAILGLFVAAKVDKPPKAPKKGVEAAAKKDAKKKGKKGADTTEPATETPVAAEPEPAPPPAETTAAPEPVKPVVAAPAPEAAPRVKPPMRIAVYELELQDVKVPVGVVVSESLLGEVRKLQGVSAIGMQEIRDMLTHEATKQLAGCSESGESCMAELAGALGVDELLTGKLAKVGDSSVMTLRRIDHKRAAVTKVFDQRLKLGSGQEYLAAVGPAVEQMFADFQLRNGQTRGVAKEVALRLDPPPIPRAATAVVGALAVGTAIAAGVFSVLFLTSQSQYKTYGDLGVGGGQISGERLVGLGETVKQQALISNVLWGTAGGLGLVTGVMAFFTDWRGYREQQANLTTSVGN